MNRKSANYQFLRDAVSKEAPSAPLEPAADITQAAEIDFPNIKRENLIKLANPEAPSETAAERLDRVSRDFRTFLQGSNLSTRV